MSPSISDLIDWNQPVFVPTSACAFLSPVGRILYSYLGPHAKMASRDVLKVSALNYKDTGMTDEEFEKHVTEKIDPAWVNLVKRHEVMRYSIVSAPTPPGASMPCSYLSPGRYSLAFECG